MRIWWLVAALVMSAALAFFDHIALAYYLYWRYPWSDTAMHLLGGAMVGALAVGLINEFKPKLYAVAVILVSAGWELFEYLIHATTYGKSFFLDTSSDLLFDAIGAVLVYVIARYTLWRSV